MRLMIQQLDSMTENWNALTWTVDKMFPIRPASRRTQTASVSWRLGCQASKLGYWLLSCYHCITFTILNVNHVSQSRDTRLSTVGVCFNSLIENQEHSQPCLFLLHWGSLEQCPNDKQAIFQNRPCWSVVVNNPSNWTNKSIESTWIPDDSMVFCTLQTEDAPKALKLAKAPANKYSIPQDPLQAFCFLRFIYCNYLYKCFEWF